MKHGLIFDLDGTLINSLGGISFSLNHALHLSGLPTHLDAAVRGFIGNGANILIRRAAPAGTVETLIETLEEAFKTHYDTTWPEGTVLYEGILPMLGTLQSLGHPLAVLSNKPHPFTEAIVRRLFPTIRFTAVLGQRPGILHKPDPAGALEIARSFQLDPADCTVIGDSTMDIETARNAGMRSVAVTWGFHDREPLLAAGADLTADTPAEVAAIFH